MPPLSDRRSSLPSGPHRRYDPLSDQWVLVSSGRTQRPWLGRTERRATIAERPAYDPACYLCPGNVRANVQNNIRAAFRAFRDENRDGRADP